MTNAISATPYETRVHMCRIISPQNVQEGAYGGLFALKYGITLNAKAMSVSDRFEMGEVAAVLYFHITDGVC